MKWKYVNISDFTDSEYNYWFSLMDKEKQKKVNDYKDEDNKKRSVAGEMLAKKMIANECGISPEKINFKTGVFGKPKIVDININFNISHSDEIVVCCISNTPIGIDIEKIKPLKSNILHKVCTTEDLFYILGKTLEGNCFELSEEQLKRFYEVWTAKEAYFKCIGTGIKNLKSISIDTLNNIRKNFLLDNYVITIIEDY